MACNLFSVFFFIYWCSSLLIMMVSKAHQTVLANTKNHEQNTLAHFKSHLTRQIKFYHLNRKHVFPGWQQHIYIAKYKLMFCISISMLLISFHYSQLVSVVHTLILWHNIFRFYESNHVLSNDPAIQPPTLPRRPFNSPSPFRFIRHLIFFLSILQFSASVLCCQTMKYTSNVYPNRKYYFHLPMVVYSLFAESYKLECAMSITFNSSSVEFHQKFELCFLFFFRLLSTQTPI